MNLSENMDRSIVHSVVCSFVRPSVHPSFVDRRGAAGVERWKGPLCSESILCYKILGGPMLESQKLGPVQPVRWLRLWSIGLSVGLLVGRSFDRSVGLSVGSSVGR